MDAVDGFHQIREGIGVAEADVAIAILSEAAAVEAGDAGFVEQVIGEFARADASAADVGEGVEGAAGKGTAEAGDLVEAGDEGVAATPAS